MSDGTSNDDTPSELIPDVVALVDTGPLPLGAYTSAEVAAVGGLIDWLEQEPGPEPMAEAIRSLAARDLIATNPGDGRIEVRGDLGIALAFQHRSRVILDARVTGTRPDEPWRFQLMPQLEQITLEVCIDTLGIHSYCLRTTKDALRRLAEQLPSGERGPGDAEFDATLAASSRTALVTVTNRQDNGARESTDLILAGEDQRLHVFARDVRDPSRFVAQPLDSDEFRALIEALMSRPATDQVTESTA